MNSNDIENIIIEEELQSFKYASRRLNVDETSFLNELKSSYLGYLNEDKEYFKKVSNKNEVDDFFHKDTFTINEVKTSFDFFKYMKRIESEQRDMIKKILHIMSPIFPYTGHLNTDFFSKFPVPNNFFNFLDNIYYYNVFSNNFDPTTLLESLDENIFLIRNSFLFDSALTHAIIPLIINFSAYVNFNGTPFTKRVKNTRKSIAIKILEISTLLNKDNSELEILKILKNDESSFDSLSDTNMFLGREIYYGIKMYSNFHEYAHIIYSHFEEKNKSHFIMELEADIFAINCLIYHTLTFYEFNKNNKINNFAICMNIVSPLIYMMIKIAQMEKADNKLSETIFRFEFIKKFIQKNLLNLNLLEVMHDFISDLEVISFHLYFEKVDNFNSLLSILQNSGKVAEKEKLHYIFYNLKKAEVESLAFSDSDFQLYWKVYSETMIDFINKKSKN